MVKNNFIHWHEEVLDRKTKEAAQKMAPLLNSQFYLAGGTGLALQIGHRISLDLDFFSQKNHLTQSDRLGLLDQLKSLGKLEILENKEGTCHLHFKGVLVSFFYYPYSLLEPPILWHHISMAHMGDIAAMKLSAVVGRGSKKDFIDLYFMCKGFGLEKILKRGVQKFKDHPNFNIQVLKALVYFQDADKEPMPKMLIPVQWDEVKSYFESKVPQIIRKEAKRYG